MPAEEKIYWVYVLLSLRDQHHYYGLSADVSSRVKQHNAGKVRSTKARRPFVLIYSEKVGSLAAARERERYLKSAAGRHFLMKMLTESKGSGSPPA